MSARQLKDRIIEGDCVEAMRKHALATIQKQSRKHQPDAYDVRRVRHASELVDAITATGCPSTPVLRRPRAVRYTPH